jgi:hypothetical protein
MVAVDLGGEGKGAVMDLAGRWAGSGARDRLGWDCGTHEDLLSIMSTANVAS